VSSAAKGRAVVTRAWVGRQNLTRGGPFSFFDADGCEDTAQTGRYRGLEVEEFKGLLLLRVCHGKALSSPAQCNSRSDLARIAVPSTQLGWGDRQGEPVVKRLALSAGRNAFFAVTLAASPATAGNEANFVLYNQNVAEKGEVEVEFLSDFSNVGSGEPNYTAQVIELEYGVTDRWTTALYVEGNKEEGDDYQFGGWRFENRLRVFEGNVFLNPVLYAEYEQLQPEHKYLFEVVGRAGEEEDEDEATEHELETRLILGQDVTDRLNLAFNWINEVNFDNGEWEFGYAAGLNFVLFEEEEQRSRSWEIKELILGLEFYGGLGDSAEGLTMSGSETAQYAGINLKTEFANGFEIGVGGAFGLTDLSEDALLRTSLSYAFE
jgi:hypothetical protein